MLPRLHLSMFLLSAVLLLAHSKPVHSESQLPEPATTTKKVMTRKEPLQPVPAAVGLDPKKVELGEKLFHEPQLSRDNKVSCATCHDLKTGGVDNKARSVGVKGAEGDINSPTVFNASLNFKQFWDGRANTLEEQVDGPIENPKEMDMTYPEVISKLRALPAYVSAFKAIYPDGITKETIRDAIATFERSLVTPDSRFDKFLRGDQNAITAEEKEGYQLFRDLGCVQCHQGAGVGGKMFQTFGLFGDYFSDRGNITQADLGRFNVTKNEEDKFTFKVPLLRNVALTAPYFHDGSAKTLEDAVQVMTQYQLGREPSEKETRLLVKFLHTLTGEYKGQPLETGTSRVAQQEKR
jgi:cytochrome c peroxidase